MGGIKRICSHNPEITSPVSHFTSRGNGVGWKQAVICICRFHLVVVLEHNVPRRTSHVDRLGLVLRPLKLEDLSTLGRANRSQHRGPKCMGITGERRGGSIRLHAHARQRTFEAFRCIS